MVDLIFLALTSTKLGVPHSRPTSGIPFFSLKLNQDHKNIVSGR